MEKKIKEFEDKSKKEREDNSAKPHARLANLEKEQLVRNNCKYQQALLSKCSTIVFCN